MNGCISLLFCAFIPFLWLSLQNYIFFCTYARKIAKNVWLFAFLSYFAAFRALFRLKSLSESSKPSPIITQIPLQTSPNISLSTILRLFPAILCRLIIVFVCFPKYYSGLKYIKMRLFLACVKIPMIFIYSAPKTHTKRPQNTLILHFSSHLFA